MTGVGLLLLALVACGKEGQLVITSPVGGSHVSSVTVTVNGTAPANAEVIRDIPSGFDDRTLSDARGVWTMTAELDVGDNVLTFRLADDTAHSSQQQILVVRDR